MARKQTVQSSPVTDVQSLVLGQLEDAKKRLATFEKELVKRGRAQQKEIESLIKGVRSGKQVKLIEKQVNVAGTEVKKRLDGLQESVLGVLGVASRSEIADLNRELARLSKKVDALASKKSSSPSA
jgi:polyhydroxyalkanoate synthesis regulator phasin